MEQKIQNQPATAKPAVAKGADKLSKPTMILGYVAFGMLIVGLVMAIVAFVVNERTANASGEAYQYVIALGVILAILSQLIALAAGIMLLVKSLKVDTDAKIKKANFIMSICIMAGILVLIIFGMLTWQIDAKGYFVVPAIIGLLLGAVTILVASIRTTLQLKKAKAAK